LFLTHWVSTSGVGSRGPVKPPDPPGQLARTAVVP
jgi:hypothetical protein